MLHRGKTRANMRYARRSNEAAEFIARHYTRRYTYQDVLIFFPAGACKDRKSVV
jgi:hypothetical protein